MASVNDILRTVLSLLDLLFDEDEQLTVTGAVTLEDSSGMTVGHAWRCTVPTAKKITTVMEVRTNKYRVHGDARGPKNKRNWVRDATGYQTLRKL